MLNSFLPPKTFLYESIPLKQRNVQQSTLFVCFNSFKEKKDATFAIFPFRSPIELSPTQQKLDIPLKKPICFLFFLKFFIRRYTEASKVVESMP
ncbi:hypothetical protein F0562_033238 [Nyssa sinensis]|uniref:Uncharacterized protein n=1 Tax=Nyssa sinensis TaxID=561372 RepID=A0A5J5ASE5_9ASTE|nr:hypothetical protein F0562_033238 [Nyssa sinensis]